MIVAAACYLDHPGEAEDVREALAGNQCRCTGYTRVFDSVTAALARLRGTIAG
jgi:aerobic-type carbon monoxide dehydrogenase small subunit (CoxS/CutS family)